MFNRSVFLIQEEDEVPDDETLNQMIARREEEFDLFMVMLQESWGTTAFLIPSPSFWYPGCLQPAYWVEPWY